MCAAHMKYLNKTVCKSYLFPRLLTSSSSWPQVVWYLVSDSTALRKAAVEKYGSKILTAVDAPLGHISQVPNHLFLTCFF